MFWQAEHKKTNFTYIGLFFVGQEEQASVIGLKTRFCGGYSDVIYSIILKPVSLFLDILEVLFRVLRWTFDEWLYFL